METTSPSDPVVSQIESLSHTRLPECYQCGKCTAGCPMAAHMDVPPTRLMRLLQLGDSDSALRASPSGNAFRARPAPRAARRSVDCAGVMDALRQLAFERGAASPDERRTVLFQKAFLETSAATAG